MRRAIVDVGGVAVVVDGVDLRRPVAVVAQDAGHRAPARGRALEAVDQEHRVGPRWRVARARGGRHGTAGDEHDRDDRDHQERRGRAAPGHGGRVGATAREWASPRRRARACGYGRPVLVLVRHGQTEANARGLLLGRADPPLSELGQRQAAALATRVPEDARVIASPLTPDRGDRPCVRASGRGRRTLDRARLRQLRRPGGGGGTRRRLEGVAGRSALRARRGRVARHPRPPGAGGVRGAARRGARRAT